MEFYWKYIQYKVNAIFQWKYPNICLFKCLHFFPNKKPVLTQYFNEIPILFCIRYIYFTLAKFFVLNLCNIVENVSGKYYNINVIAKREWVFNKGKQSDYEILLIASAYDFN